MFAAGSSEAALAFLEIGAVVLGLGLLARLAGRIGITAVPLYRRQRKQYANSSAVQTLIRQHS